MANPTLPAKPVQPSGIVHIIDDDEAVRDSLRMLCTAAHLQAQIYSSAAGFLRSADLSAGGCIVLDIRMPGTSGLELQDELHKRRVQLPIIFLTGHADVPMAVRALKRGAFDFIEKPPELQALLVVICNALRGAIKAEPVAFSTTKSASSSDAPHDWLLNQLTVREREVLAMVMQGVPSRTIAQTLCLSLKTVEFHRARIREKFGVNSTLELVRMLSGQ